MSSVVSSVLNVTFGLLWNKLRDYTAEKLKEGDVTDEKFRKLIVNKLDDIKSKLDGLAQKDLRSSVEFFKEGISGLRMCVDGLTDDRNSSISEPVLNEEFPSASLNLDQAMTTLKITSEDRFKLAKDSFKAAREEATRAFSNEALSTEDRIFATKLRISSSIMENLKDLEFAATNSKMYLKALHDLPAIKEAFSVHLDGGIKSWFNQSLRLEIVQSVTMISSVLYDFTSRFTKITQGLFDWPEIDLGKRSYHPLSVDASVSLDEFGGVTHAPIRVKYDGKDEIMPWCSAVNSKGEIITQSGPNAVSVMNREGKCRIFCSLPSGDTVATGHSIASLAVDEEDNVYVVPCSEKNDLATGLSYRYAHALFVFDSNGNVKNQWPLDFLPHVLAKLLCFGEYYHLPFLCIAVNKEKRIAITECGSRTVFICDDTGQLKAQFDMEEMNSFNPLLCCSDTNEIIQGLCLDKTVAVYTEEGKLKRKIELPECHNLFSVAFNYITKNIVVLTFTDDKDVYLINYPETDKPQCLCLGSVAMWTLAGFHISSHPNGPVAVLNGLLGVGYIHGSPI